LAGALAPAGNNIGVNLNGSIGLFTTGGGAITITGTAGDNGGSGIFNPGVNIASAISGSGGAITITGTGGNSSGG